VDGTLIEAWASLKSFRPKGEQPSDRTPPDDQGNPSVDFHGSLGALTPTEFVMLKRQEVQPPQEGEKPDRLYL
jgi:hypothetical protein